MKILNKGEEEELVCCFPFYFFASVRICAFQLIRGPPLFSLKPLGATGLPSLPLAGGVGWPWGAVYRGLASSAAVLDARVVCQIHLHSYHSP